MWKQCFKIQFCILYLYLIAITLRRGLKSIDHLCHHVYIIISNYKMFNNDLQFCSQMEMRSLYLRKFHPYYRWYIQIFRQSKKVWRANHSNDFLKYTFIVRRNWFPHWIRLSSWRACWLPGHVRVGTSNKHTANRLNLNEQIRFTYILYQNSHITGNAASTNDDSDTSKRNVNPEDYSIPIKANIVMRLFLKTINSQSYFIIVSQS